MESPDGWRHHHHREDDDEYYDDGRSSPESLDIAVAPPVVRQQTYRILCKAGEEGFSLGVRDGEVCLVGTDQEDDAQHWIKDTKYSTRVKDEEGYPAIALVNKATGEALQHSLGQSHPVRLASYDPSSLDLSVLWTQSRDVGEGYRCIRMVSNIYLNFDALNGDEDHGGVQDGTTLVLWEWAEGDNQRWKIVDWCKFLCHLPPWDCLASLSFSCRFRFQFHV
ncbi:hypothetical protein ACQ4PT_042967 [Festuca glaucescens]